MRTDPATRELQRRAIGTIAIRHHEISTRLSDDYLFTQDGLQELPITHDLSWFILSVIEFRMGHRRNSQPGLSD